MENSNQLKNFEINDFLTTMSDKSEIIKNIEAELIPLLSWENKDTKQKSIEYLYKDVQNRYKKVIEWYLQRKTDKRIIAQRLRRWAILLICIAAAGLVVTSINAGEPWAKIPGSISSALLTFAAGLIAYDRFFGFSSSWIRFILTAMRLQKELIQFQTSLNQLSIEDSQDKNDILKKKVQRIKEAYEFIYFELLNEAHQWAEEFRGNLDRSVTELVEQFKSGAGKTNSGGFNLGNHDGKKE